MRRNFYSIIKTNKLKILRFSFKTISSIILIINLISCKQTSGNKSKNTSDGVILDDTLTLLAVGDIMLGTNYPSDAYLPPDSIQNILKPIQEILQNADITFGNLEGVFLSKPASPKKICFNNSVCNAFKMPDFYVDFLVSAGFDVLSIANNHITDFGTEGTDNTQLLLKENRIAFAGLESCPTTIINKKGINIGFAAFAPNARTNKMNEYEKVKQQIQHLDSVCDVVIVSFHGGAEGGSRHRITRETEYYLRENRGNPYEFARIVIDAGADVVIGHGPHVPRALDVYKNRLIAYSLGNFATYRQFSLWGRCGLAPILKIWMSKKGELHRAEIISCLQVGEGGPFLDAENRVAKEMKMFTERDIPESELLIFENGRIQKR